ncbi:protein suppressor of variegation 3-7-like [Teleopsis dalmanni]|uniref:protein suppressor of variegation 3-7-like n=1 Tax=Teleopsis dalmanni TaxID=139649 RepID=UPI0018CCCD32|nr:protein suppressor of variegation 3-7-like [Teleopsis dalmanni]
MDNTIKINPTSIIQIGDFKNPKFSGCVYKKYWGRKEYLNCENWTSACRKYKWIARDEEKGYYCVCCDVKICLKRLKRHSKSILHKEFSSYQLEFMEYKELNNSNMHLKREIESNDEASNKMRNELFNFNEFLDFIWYQWLKSYYWLERVEGTIGMCKFCLIKINCKYIHLRERHQRSQAHKDAVKLNGSGEENGVFTMNNWLLTLTNFKEQSYCVLCDIYIKSIYFKHHTRGCNHTKFLTLIHKDQSIVNETAEKIKNETLFIINSKTYSCISDELRKKYDWVSYDGQNALMAFCKVCNKNITLPWSETKLKLHEKIAHGEYRTNIYKNYVESSQRIEECEENVYQTKRMHRTKENMNTKRAKYAEDTQSNNDEDESESDTLVSTRNTYDLFFRSVSETVKRIPRFLAVEAKLTVSKIIYDLEMRAMRRL